MGGDCGFRIELGRKKTVHVVQNYALSSTRQAIYKWALKTLSFCFTILRACTMEMKDAVGVLHALPDA